jgi:hypothetical protein
MPRKYISAKVQSGGGVLINLLSNAHEVAKRTRTSVPYWAQARNDFLDPLGSGTHPAHETPLE